VNNLMSTAVAKPKSANAVAVITGAGSGIGASFAEQAFQLGYRLLLIDISSDNLDAVRSKLLENSEDPSIHERVELLVANLADRPTVESLAERLAQDADIELLTNCAGFGEFVEFVDVDVKRHLDMISLHVETPMRLIHAVLPNMKQRRHGGIINVASLGAFTPCAQSVQYAATKSYLIVFSEALQEELLGTGVRVQALCPGFVRTGFHATESMKNFHQRKIPNNLWTTPDQVAACSLRSLFSGRVVVIPGWQSRVLGLVTRMVLLKPFVRAATRPKPGRKSAPLAPPTADNAVMGIAEE
jgi:short-subunit dehydrogenase